MDDTKTNDVPVFEAGDTAHLRFTATDDNGVVHAEIRFRNKSKNLISGLFREIELSGEPQVTAEFVFDVGELAPGHYVCEYVALTDGLGNRSLFATPEIEFYVEGNEKDHEGPTLLDLSFA